MADTNIVELLNDLNDTYFDGALCGLQVKWSPYLKKTNGLCIFKQTDDKKTCSIRLSKSLLKERPRSDIIQTLLHEMIHAALFLSHDIIEDHSLHGPKFLEEMERINQASGENLTTSHTFDNEDNDNKFHIWRCEGICKEDPPFYGYVKRLMNRPPSYLDNWSSKHEKYCGGDFLKIQTPPNYSKTDNICVSPNKTEQQNKDVDSPESTPSNTPQRHSKRLEVAEIISKEKPTKQNKRNSNGDRISQNISTSQRTVKNKDVSYTEQQTGIDQPCSSKQSTNKCFDTTDKNDLEKRKKAFQSLINYLNSVLPPCFQNTNKY